MPEPLRTIYADYAHCAMTLGTETHIDGADEGCAQNSPAGRGAPRSKFQHPMRAFRCRSHICQYSVSLYSGCPFHPARRRVEPPRRRAQPRCAPTRPTRDQTLSLLVGFDSFPSAFDT